MRTATLLPSLVVLASTVLAQVSPPAQGIQLSAAYDVRFPLTVSQCEPVFIYYNTTGAYSLTIRSPGSTTGTSPAIALITIPVGIGYLEWVCHIPAGHAFVVEGWYERYFVVQPGSSSACLHALTTTYSYVQYTTAAFQSYTSNPPTTVTPSISDFLANSTLPFPTTQSFSTITINPGFMVTPTTSSTSTRTTTSTTPGPSTPGPTPPSPPLSRKSNTAAIAGGTIGAIALVAILVAIIFFWRRKNRTSQQVAYQPTATSEPFAYGGPMGGQTGPMMPPQGPPIMPGQANFSPSPPASYWQSSTASTMSGPPMPVTTFPDHPPNLRPASIPSSTNTSSYVSSEPLYRPGPSFVGSSSLSSTPPSTGYATGYATGYPMDVKSKPVVLSYPQQPLPPPTPPTKGVGRSQTQPSPPLATGSEPATDVLAAVNNFARMDPNQQQTLVSVLNALVRPEAPPAEAPLPPGANVPSPPPYSM